MDSVAPDATHLNDSPKAAKPGLAQNKESRQADNPGVKFNFSGTARGKTVQVQNIQQQGTVTVPKIPSQAATAKLESISKVVQQPQPKVLKEKPVANLQQASHNSSSGKSEISSLSRGHSHGESFPDNTNSQHSQGENFGHNQSERKDAAILPELTPQWRLPWLKLTGSATNASAGPLGGGKTYCNQCGHLPPEGVTALRDKAPPRGRRPRCG